jgi:2-polyprenyl-6-methoxyphenol hydroxylase-like FAD-dependent oxidoreductase
LNDHYWDWSPTSVLHIPQDKFEQILKRYICKQESADLLTYFSNVNASLDIKSVSSKIKLNLTPVSKENVNSEQCVTCDFLVAADGANSSIRKNLNIKLVGKPSLQTLLNGEKNY